MNTLSVILHQLKSSDDNLSQGRYERYCAQLIALLVDQWPRQASTAEQMLSQLSDELPVVIALIDQQSDTVVAACKLSRVGSSVVPTGTVLEDVPEDLSTALLLQNVIVQRSLRGAGLGRRLLSHVEAYATSNGFTALTLGTNDQVPFYLRCGFHVLPSGVSFAPSTASAAKLDKGQLGALLAVFGGGGGGVDATKEDDVDVDSASGVDDVAVVQSERAPPPPPPAKTKAKCESTQTTQCDSWMAKRI